MILCPAQIPHRKNSGERAGATGEWAGRLAGLQAGLVAACECAVVGRDLVRVIEASKAAAYSYPCSGRRNTLARCKIAFYLWRLDILPHTLTAFLRLHPGQPPRGI
jgi:hypothetical protein